MVIFPISVLIIENHPLMREALCAAIDMEPDLAVAGNADQSADVLHLAQNLKPDMVLLALGNPGLDDLAAITALRENLPEIYILALVSDEVPGQEQQALDCGAHMAMTKAAPRAALLQSIRKIGL